MLTIELTADEAEFLLDQMAKAKIEQKKLVAESNRQGLPLSELMACENLHLAKRVLVKTARALETVN
jgi:hypothetical protein